MKIEKNSKLTRKCYDVLETLPSPKLKMIDSLIPPDERQNPSKDWELWAELGDISKCLSYSKNQTSLKKFK